jgi:hypothetical protein
VGGPKTVKKVITSATIVVLLVVSLFLPVRAGPLGQGPPPRPPGPTDETPRGHITPADVEAQATISEGFEGGSVPPAGWTRIQTNPNETWEIENYDPHSGRYCAHVLYDTALQDEVLRSPCFTPDSGTVTLWTFGNLYWCRDTLDNCDLEVWFVNGSWDGGGGDDVRLGLVDNDWLGTWIWSYSTFDFSPYASGNPARIALRYVGKDGAEIGVDDIRIDYTGTSCGDDKVFLPIILRNH